MRETTLPAPMPPTSTHLPDGGRAWGSLLLLTLVAGVSAPGQTIGISVFIDPMLSSLPVSRTQLSTAYLLATVAGATALPWVGTWTDRVGVRRALLLVLWLLVLATAAASKVSGLLGVTAAFLALRLLGQGSLGVVTGTGVAVWFERRRGLAMGLLSTGSALLLAGAPLLFGWLIATRGWRSTWLVAAGLVAIVLILIAVALPDQPSPDTDGDHAAATPVTTSANVRTVPPVSLQATGEGTAEPSPTTSVHLDRRQALRTWSFWGIALISGAINLFVTAVTFHHLSVMAERGLSPLQATAVFIPQMLGGLVSGLAAGTLADRWAGHRTLALCIGVCAAGLATGTMVEPGVLAAVYGVLIGAAPGAIRAVEGVLLPAWFGTRHVGSIRGALASITIASTAVGPLVLSLLEVWSFTVGLRVLAVAAALLVGVAWSVRAPQTAGVA